MKRFRITILVVCCVLVYMGITDLNLTLSNPEPKPVSVDQVLSGKAPQDWLTIENGTLHLLDAVSTSGELEIEALLVPLRQSEEAGPIRLLLETQDPELIKAFSTYFILLETDEQRNEYVAQNPQLFFNKAPRTGLITSGLVAENNRSRMRKLAKQIGLPVENDVMFISEGKEPPTWRGVFFLLVGLAGGIRVLSFWRQNPVQPLPPTEET